MSASRFEITGKTKQDLTTFVSIQDFELGSGTPVETAVFFQDPTLTLYGYDPTRETAVFVKTPESVDLTEAPFFYQAQYQEATHVYMLPATDFIDLAEKRPLPNRPLIMLHSVGRCGSTLLSQLFDAIPQVVSLSEPDIFTNFLLMRERNGRLDHKITQLLKATLKFQCKPLTHHSPQQWAIKFRSANFEIADLLIKTDIPQTNIFLYRNIHDRTQSAIRAFDLEANAKQKIKGPHLQRWLKLVPLLNQYKWQAKWGRLDKVDLSILAWLSRMDTYLKLYESDNPLIALKYEALIENPQPFIVQLLALSGYSPDLLPLLLPVFEKDSQAGSSLSRKAIQSRTNSELTPAQMKQIGQFLKKHPVINSPHFTLPNTLTSNTPI